jgi:hypothetical protein
MASKKSDVPLDAGGLMYQNLRKLINIIVRIFAIKLNNI